MKIFKQCECEKFRLHLLANNIRIKSKISPTPSNYPILNNIPTLSVFRETFCNVTIFDIIFPNNSYNKREIVIYTILSPLYFCLKRLKSLKMFESFGKFMGNFINRLWNARVISQLLYSFGHWRWICVTNNYKCDCCLGSHFILFYDNIVSDVCEVQQSEVKPKDNCRNYFWKFRKNAMY